MFLTYTGKVIDVRNLRQKDISLKDIAHSLALQCRYGGHCKYFYSVAEHSVRAAEIAHDYQVDPRYMLLHDAAEAYCGDVVNDIKGDVLNLEIEEKIRKVIFSSYGLKEEYWKEHYEHIKQVDHVMLLTEIRDLMPERAKEFYDFSCCHERIILPWEWKLAEKLFLRTAEDLGLHDSF